MERYQIEDLIARNEVDVMLYTEERGDGTWKVTEVQYIHRTTRELLLVRPPKEIMTAMSLNGVPYYGD